MMSLPRHSVLYFIIITVIYSHTCVCAPACSVPILRVSWEEL